MNDTPSVPSVSGATDTVRVRMAPSPTGFLHIGGARTALFNWLFAKHHNGTFILRIDDTDTARSTDESMHEIYDALKWLGIHWDEQYVQSERKSIYEGYVEQLLESGNAYHCYCTPEELEEIRAQARADKLTRSYDGRHRHLTSEDVERFVAEGRKPAVRIKMPDTPILVEDIVLGSRSIDPDTLEDEVIVRSNGMPNYNLTSIIDDAELQITHVIRGTEHLNNTPKQIAIANALGLKVPQFAHIPLVLDSSGRKMSKRHHGDLVAVNRYREQGYLPEAVLNFVVRLGWSYDDKQEIFSVDELIEKFDLARVGKSGSVFDIKKLEWLNSHYINQLSVSARTDAVIPFWQEEGLIDSTEKRDWLENIVEAVGERLTTFQDIIPQTRYFFTDAFEYEPKAVKKWWGGSEEKREKTAEILTNLLQILEEVPLFDVETIETTIWKYTDENDIKRVAAMQALRIALTGTSFGPSLFDIVALLGRDEVLKRIPRAIAHL
ncbi:glutamate--tRNA ligase [Candidatus Poribacteria bacterium]|nr:glutamate--tRNA ligase [Candidatus Poribacteria bacterium]MYG05774.1 glutamate--tRNA ligase [Candidatus Poribacteria bacterium]MYK24944.1 glutamate--tRNA ligase [Candidatus Poribacteria bacterium]